ncbi:GlxA family transcriptional regulator [Cupriavidus pauculus]|uniref:GlxA family transcriptional regulator n=1 Tax=Cupriavidus pauculus TaxID=82633 RepID=A0A5P2H1C5_9BURK|nr:GlxA family transcriptional regulator [Cupriavidus pauculus]QET01671.1 GlxA family transcriptional regulator [Cupriavidus pauculus]
MDASLALRHIGFFVYPGFQIQDLSGPLAAFELAGSGAGAPPYRCHVVSHAGGDVASSGGLRIMTSLMPSTLDTLLVVGGEVSDDPATLPAIDAHLATALQNGTRRIGSVCTGAFILARAGLLEGRRATTHWKHSRQLQRMFPGTRVESDRIYIKDGNIWTSAGVTAGIDLALALIEEDLGHAESLSVARHLVVYHRRPGGQSQFSALADMEPESDRMREVLSYMRENLNASLSTETLASIACLSPRQFGRTFLAETGETPAKAVERLRVEVARHRVERSAEPIEKIAEVVGFADPERMRRAFIRITGHPPQSLRRMAD